MWQIRKMFFSESERLALLCDHKTQRSSYRSKHPTGNIGYILSSIYFSLSPVCSLYHQTYCVHIPNTLPLLSLEELRILYFNVVNISAPTVHVRVTLSLSPQEALHGCNWGASVGSRRKNQ